MLSPDTMLHERYRIGRQLGRGSMGAVYLALDQKFATSVAVKETLAETDDRDAWSAFQREAALLNRLRHPALAHVIDYFHEAERQYLVMQFVEGENLGSALKERIDSGQGPFPPDQVLDWADHLLDALDYIHRHEPSVLHLDIKPHNLILEPNQRLMLVDFGLARVKHRDENDYSSMAAYTPPYASIEQLNNDGLDPRSDLFSLGVTLYHLIAGRLPFDALRRIGISGLDPNADPLVPLHQLVPAVSPAVTDVITRAMALLKKDRFDSAADMRQHLMMARQATYLHRPERDAPIPHHYRFHLRLHRRRPWLSYRERLSRAAMPK